MQWLTDKNHFLEIIIAQNQILCYTVGDNTIQGGICLNSTKVIEYKCPCCSAGLKFDGHSQQLTCEYCDNSFVVETVRAFNESEIQPNEETFHWENTTHNQWSEEEQDVMRSFTCPSCGGELITDENTAATFCPYCANPTVMPGRLTGGLKPDALIPFQKTKEDAKAAFLNLCKGKPLLPKFFTQEQQLEKITGIYVPFWLYDCSGGLEGSYKATRVQSWADSKYNYTKTDHYLLRRGAKAAFTGIPMDGSSKMDDTFMESIEPYDYSQLIDFDKAYLSGYFADKYDIPSENGEDRIRRRVNNAINDLVQSSLVGYTTVIPTSQQLKVDQGIARYVLMPVWMLNTRYKGKIYTFAMNGQTGKITGELPISTKRTALWFAGITAGVTLLATLVQLML